VRPEPPLVAELKRRIRLEGPLTVAHYMALCLGHPQHGYYRTRDPLGTAGDFTTAPEISQMFGELIGLWAAEVWRGLGSPAVFQLVELGPGRGTLMADALRATRRIPGFHAAATLNLIETSPFLQRIQADRLAGCGLEPLWHEALPEVAEGPSIIIGNEFLDALPIRQFIRSEEGWHERLIGLDPAGAMVFGLSAHSSFAAQNAGGAMIRPGAFLEISPAQEFLITDTIAPRLLSAPGAALFLDYGSPLPDGADTLQALFRHERVHPLAFPGESDLTAHVPFAALAASATRAGLACHGPMPQREFLAALGLAERAQALHDGAEDEASRQAVASAFDRLMDASPGGMGALFQAFGLSSPGLALPGLPLSKERP
jgi:NADH dehydrogenase [ubiquinone] 1 alpha subcomplex assembly factor 7